MALDALVRVEDQGQPVFSTEPDTAFVAVEMLRPTHMQHDVLSRVRLVERPDTNGSDGYARTAIEHDLSMFEGRLLFEEMVIDANGKVRNTYRDVGGRIGAVEEFNRIEGVERQIVTRYEHNPLDELERVTDANGNVTQAAYDTVGRMVELVSPDAGRTEWRYDLVGNLRAKQDAELAQRGQLIRYEYEHNRLRKIDYPVTEDVVYTYGAPNEGGDAKGNRAGRVKEETSAAGTRSYGYDRFGNVAELTAEFPRLREPHRGPYEATMRYAFDALGRMQELRFPGSGEEVVRYGYDHGGLLITATGENQGINQQRPNEPRTTEYLKHIGYDEHGQRVRMVAGNGVETRYRYDESTRRLEDVDADHQSAQMRWMGRAPRPFQRLRYRYDLVGNLLELNNEVPYDESLGGSVMVAATQQRFQYDDLNQLTDASGIYQERSNEQERYNLGLKYDVLGNVEEKGQEVAKYASDGRGGWNKQYEIRESTYRNAYRYNGPRPHAPREVDEYVVAESQPRLRELRYDASGRQIEWRYRGNHQRSLEWDEDGRLVLVKENTQEISRALYDGAGERRVHLHRVAGEEETAYVDQHLVLRNGQYATKHIFAGETRIASKLDADWLPVPPVLYYHPDHLGSTQYVTDADQALSQHAEYLPSGELWADQTDSRFQNRQPYLFNGKELDLSTGLYHYGARSYEPRLGVWLSPDPILDQYMRGAPNGGVYSPSNLGLYTYTGNNPVLCIDKDGRFAWVAVAAVAVGVLLTPQYANAPGHNEPIHDSKSGIELGYEMAQGSLTAYGAMSNPAGFAQAYMQQQAIATLKDAADTVDPSGTLRGAIEKVEPVASMMAPGGKGGGLKLGVKASAPRAPKATKPDGYAGRYGDGTLVKESQRPPHVSGPDPAAAGRPHTVLRWDANGRLYGAKEFGDGGMHPTRDISFTQPTFPNGAVRPGHGSPPTAHPYLPNATGGSPKRGKEGPLNP
ncbi:RHS repeat-associated core domain-containing protein [Sorangium sp. So ce1036]|uniref:RHS repeat domain-containing protein n=1 Tax=Sorangium sp. So ce1036 TaxID=3133328 RepID=UPI003EFBECC6